MKIFRSAMIAVSVAVALLIIASCTKKADAVGNLLDMKPGMTKEDVVKTLGDDYTMDDMRMVYQNKPLLSFTDAGQSTKAKFFLNDSDVVYSIGYYTYNHVDRDFKEAEKLIKEKYGDPTTSDDQYTEWVYDGGAVSLAKGTDYIAIGIY